MAKVQKRTRIELTRQEKEFLDNLLSSLYQIDDDDEVIAEIFSDIYNSYKPRENEKISTWEGVFTDIIIKD